MNKYVVIALVLTFSLFVSISLIPQATASDYIQVKGSDTMVNLGQAWAERYMEKYPDAFIAVTGGGSGTGIAALISGTCDIAECSRAMKNREIELAKNKEITPKEMIVALDGIAVVVNPKNPVSKLTFSQLAAIFTGKVNMLYHQAR